MYVHTYVCTNLFLYVCVYLLMNAGLVVIKKYCNFFWKSFPNDYSVTLARFCEASSRKPEENENIAICPNLEMGNLKILTLCMAGLDKDDALMIFGAIMKDMIDNPKLSKIFDVFKQGAYRIA